MAEALLTGMASEHFTAVSASTSRARMHPIMVKVMKEIGVDLSQKTPRQVEDLTTERFDYVITLDERSTRAYPNFKGAQTIHWILDDPIAASTDPEKQLLAFRMVRDQISQRLRLFIIVQSDSEPILRQPRSWRPFTSRE